MDNRNKLERLTQEPNDPETLSQLTAKQVPIGNDRMQETLPESKAWALNWDGSALFEIQGGQNRRRSFSTTDAD